MDKITLILKLEFMENNSKHPEISILLFTYEYNLNIKNVIESILKQTVSDFELIIVSNNSKKIRNFLLEFNDIRIHPVIVKSKKDFVYEGIMKAQGKYISFTSSNVAYMNDWLEHQLSYMNKNNTIGISGVYLSSYVSNMELIKVMHLRYPVLFWPSIIIKRDILQEYESLFKKRIHISTICYQLEILIVSNNEKAFGVFNNKIFYYRFESYSDSKGYDQIRKEQIKSMGVKIRNKKELHSELLTSKNQSFPFQEYKNWIQTIENYNNGRYDPDFLSGLLDSLLCSKINNPANIHFSKLTQSSDTIKILVICHNMEVVNPFISILINEINSDKYTVNYSVQDFWNMRGNYDIIHIHWPEMFYDWRIPSDNEIKRLSEFFKKWKQKGTKIVYTRHDEDFHYSMNKIMTQKMFDLVKRESDIIVHLGEYSRTETIKELNIPGQINTVIPHHVYDTIYNNNITKKTARDLLHIDNNRIIILTFGFFRDREEYLLVKEAFEQLEVENKFLLAPSWANPYIVPNGNVFLGKGKVDADMLPYCFAAADIVFIQRVKILNSGNLPMAFFFNKVVVGPNVGNVREFLDEETNFSFDCKDISTASKALYKAVLRVKSGKPVNNEKFVRENWSTSQIVEQYRSLYRTIVSKQ